MGYLRETTEDDADLLFEWTNDASVRENSFSTDEISYDEHIRWFHHMLADDTIRQYIYMHEGEPAGQIRITIDGQTAEIGYSICKEKRDGCFTGSESRRGLPAGEEVKGKSETRQYGFTLYIFEQWI